MIKAYAKANLILKVVGLNDNKYHLLQMLNARINIYDEIKIEKITSNIDQLEFKNSNLDPQKDTLVLKVLNYFKAYFQINDCFKITIYKNIPIGAGLGGGSCDVGAILVYLANLYKVDVFEENFFAKLKEYGADIPYSLYMEPCIVEGIGEKITKLSDMTNESMEYINSKFIYMYPNIKVETKKVFENNYIFSKSLSHQEILDKIKKESYFAFTNDLTSACENTYESFKNIIQEVKEYGYSVMSGSGSSILIFTGNIDDVYMELKNKYPTFYIKIVEIIKTNN